MAPLCAGAGGGAYTREEKTLGVPLFKGKPSIVDWKSQCGATVPHWASPKTRPRTRAHRRINRMPASLCKHRSDERSSTPC